MTLEEVKDGERARILHVAGEEAVRRRLGTLGFVPDTVARVVSTSYGNMIIAVHESRIAVNDATARDITVEAL